MKRSEMESALCPWVSQGDMADAVARVQAAANLGPFDPEDEPLPERLTITSNGIYITSQGDAAGDTEFLAIVHPTGIWDDVFSSPKRCAEVMAEAVRMYNVRSAMRQFIVKHLSGLTVTPSARCFGEGLLAILAGKSE